MVNPFIINYSELDDDGRALIDAATKVLENGDRLYSSFGKDDLSHITWTLSQAIHVLSQHEEPASIFLELSHDDDGFAISILTIPDKEPE